MAQSEEEKRMLWKNNRANQSYGKDYLMLCSDRKRIIDQLYLLMKMEEEEKKNSKKRGCR
jgi:hypothetical protein